MLLMLPVTRGRFRVLVYGLILMAALRSAAAELPMGSLRDVFQHAVSAFGAQDFAAALAAFEGLEADFGEEAEFRAASTQEMILPLHAYSLLVSGDPERAAGKFEAYLQSFGRQGVRRRFALLSLANALEQLGEPGRARQRYREFVACSGESPELLEARYRIAETLFVEGRTDEAIAAFREILKEPGPVEGRARARERALEIAAQEARWMLVAELLTGAPWGMDAASASEVVASASLHAAAALLEAGEAAAALRVLRRVPAYEHLRESEKGVPEMDDYSGQHRLLMGRAFAGMERWLESRTLYAVSAFDPAVSEADQRQCHYQWIVMEQRLGCWERAESVAQAYLERYPGSEEGPVILFLIANGHQQSGAHGRAVERLSELLREHPGHRLAGRWRFARGFSWVLLGDHASARKDFSGYLEGHPQGALPEEAKLWHALSWYYEKNYGNALTELRTLAQRTPGDHPLKPQLDHRLAATLYAMGEYEEAIRVLRSFVHAFPEDRSIDEVRVLLGDALMAEGGLDEALASFRGVGAATPALQAYAVFQMGKIYRARMETGNLVAHFQNYLARRDLKPHPRQSEALHWIAWGREQENAVELAVPVYAQAFGRFADDPLDGGWKTILVGLRRVFSKLDAADREEGPEPGRFDQWLKEALHECREGNRLTAWSRLKLFQVEELKALGREEEAGKGLHELAEAVSRDALCPAGLAAVGGILETEAVEEARACFVELLARFPKSPQRMEAWLGLGRMALAAECPAEASRWLALASEELPAHPERARAMVLYAEALLEEGRPEAVPALVEELLRLKSGRGRMHAEGLVLLAKANERLGQPGRAVGIYQRVYNLYRGFPEPSRAAYVESARLFEELDDPRAALRSWQELRSRADLLDEGMRLRAERAVLRLEAATELAQAEPVAREADLR